MLKIFCGFKKNAKLPPLLIPVLPCYAKTDPRCNGLFVPTMTNQKSCTFCTRFNKENFFANKTTREEILLNIKVTWIDDKNWENIEETLKQNEKEYKKYITLPFKYYQVDKG